MAILVTFTPALDVWESPQAFEEFGQTLLPILQEVGITVPPPEITLVHNLIPGAATGMPATS